MSKSSFSGAVRTKKLRPTRIRDGNMKKFTLILCFVLSLAIGLKAQTYVGEIPCYPRIVPGIFTTSGRPNIECVYEDFFQGIYNCCIYSEDFSTNIANINIDDGELITLECFGIMSNFNLSFTQTLYNTDDYYEFLVGYPCGDWELSSIALKSSNGNNIATLYPDAGYYFFRATSYRYLYVIDDNYYLVLREHNNNDEKFLIYQIGQTQGLTKLDAELPVSVFPTVANRGQQITVELGEGNNATEITVVNELGQVVKRVPVNGQSSVTIPTTGLGSGMNILNTNTAKGNSGCKIIIR